MQVDFTKIMVQRSLGTEPVETNIAELLGDFIYQTTTSLKDHNPARTIYESTGPIELPDEFIARIMTLVDGKLYTPLLVALQKVVEGVSDTTIGDGKAGKKRPKIAE